MARRLPFLPAAVLGNGGLLVTLSARGEVERMFWPHVDGPEQVHELRLAISAGADAGRPLDEAPFVWEQRYEQDATVLRTVVTDGGLRVEVVDLVDVDAPVLARNVRSESAEASLVVSVTPSLDGGDALNAGYVDPATGAFVAYARASAVAVLTDPPPGEAWVRRLATGERAAVEHRFPIAGELIVPPAPEATIYMALGADAADALAHASTARDTGFAALLQRRVGHDGRLLLAAAPPVAEEALYRRSLL